MKFKVNPRLEALANAGAKNRADVVVLRGLVAQTGESSVAIRAGLFGESIYEVSLGDIISAKDNPDGSVALMIHNNAPVVIHTTAGILQVAKDNDPRPTESQVQRCIDNSRNDCIDNQMILNGRTRQEAESICDSPAIQTIRETFCRNPINLLVSGQFAGARLGSEVVFEVFD